MGLRIPILSDIFGGGGDPEIVPINTTQLSGVLAPPPHSKETIEFVTDILGLDKKVVERNWYANMRGLSFSNFDTETERDIYMKSLEQEQRITKNNKPRYEVFRPDIIEEIEDRRYLLTADFTTKRGLRHEHAKLVLNANTTIETKTSQGEESSLVAKAGKYAGLI